MRIKRMVDRFWREKEISKLLRGMTAKLEGKELKLFKDGQPFTDFSIGATTDWMSGNFSISGQLVIEWYRGRRKKPGKFDNWKTRAEEIVEFVNRRGGCDVSVRYLEQPYTTVFDPVSRKGNGYLPGQDEFGYGNKITTDRVVVVRGRRYRIYATCISNVISYWILCAGTKLHIL